VRIVRGMEAGRALLRNRPSLDNPELPRPVRETIRRVFGAELDAGAVVERILAAVREEGDAAVRRFNEAIDGVSATNAPLEVSPEEVKAAYNEIDAGLAEALRTAADRIRAFHERQLAHASRSFEEGGLGQIVRPIERAGVYVPGNAVIYPSTLLMIAVPARVAGVSELIVATPARADGSVAPLKLVAADIAGADRVFRAGGVQGIAALAYGTESIPAVDKICGPGNIFVTLAKKRLYGEVGIDGIFGPSETLIVADANADPDEVAADMLAGAEHDELATAVLLTPAAELAEAVARIVDAKLPLLARAEAAQTSMEARGGAIITASLEEAARTASEYAPEHLCLHVEDIDAIVPLVQNAGCIFAGGKSVESIGDYTAGPSHVMPTGASARFASPLGVQDFLKATSYVRLDERVVREIGPAAAAIAHAEGLTGHAGAVEKRLGDGR
jgi:histidinol dehydrogenase